MNSIKQEHSCKKIEAWTVDIGNYHCETCLPIHAVLPKSLTHKHQRAAIGGIGVGAVTADFWFLLFFVVFSFCVGLSSIG